MISAVLKRDYRLVSFDRAKIDAAILKAFDAVGEATSPVSELAEKVAVQLEERGGIASVEEIQDVVEHALIDSGFADVAKAYILYREKRSEIRRAKIFFGVRDELKLSVNAAKVLEKRHLLKDDHGIVIESPSQMFFRVAEAVDSNRGHASEFYEVMKNLQFLPNSPTLMNAGAPLGQLSACFVLPVNDSLESIFTAVKQMSIIQQSGGGTGFSFSHLRPRGDIVRSTHGVASGPVSFIRVFDTATDVIKQGGKRRGANMAVMHVSHPDIIEFITAKAKGVFTNFNFSVAVDDVFMKALEHGEEYALINPRNREAVRSVDAESLWNLIAEKAWECGDPGLIFIDEINRHNPTPELGEIESTNPCGEQPLLPYESCNLGSINLSKLVRNEEVNWDLLSELVTTGVRFLDFVIDVNRFPLKRIAQVTRGNRKIGLGVMGFADMLVQLHTPYNSSEALKLAEQVMKHISKIAGEASMELAEKYGSYPNIDKSMHHVGRRNATLTTIAPTGSLSIIANCSSGIEPIFAISFVRNILEGARLVEVNPYFKQIAKQRGFYTPTLMNKIARTGSVANMKDVPYDVREVFKTAMDITTSTHVKMQAVFQKYTDNSVSKTINLPPDAGISDVKQAYIQAFKLKCKGITVFRYGCKDEQVLYLGVPNVPIDPEYAGRCTCDGCVY